MKLRLILLLCGAALVGCSAEQRRALWGDTGDYVGRPAEDRDPAVDSDGDGNPLNDTDNKDEILGALVELIARNPTPAGLVTVGGGLAVFLAGRALQRRRRARAEAAEVTENDDAEPS